jgi:hypothetical protein
VLENPENPRKVSAMRSAAKKEMRRVVFNEKLIRLPNYLSVWFKIFH